MTGVVGGVGGVSGADGLGAAFAPFAWNGHSGPSVSFGSTCLSARSAVRSARASSRVAPSSAKVGAKSVSALQSGSADGARATSPTPRRYPSAVLATIFPGPVSAVGAMGCAIA